MLLTDTNRGAKVPIQPAQGVDGTAILAAITDIVREVCADSGIELTPATETIVIPAWEEFSRAAIVVEAECRFNVLFQAPEIDALRTVGDLIGLIRVKCGATDG